MTRMRVEAKRARIERERKIQRYDAVVGGIKFLAVSAVTIFMLALGGGFPS